MNQPRVLPDPGNHDFIYRRGAGWQVEIWRDDVMVYEKWHVSRGLAEEAIARWHAAHPM
jgi:hypothetical protein